MVLPDLCTGVWMVEAGWMLEADVGCMGSEPKLSIMGRVTSISGPVEATLSSSTPARQPNIASTVPPQYLVPLVLVPLLEYKRNAFLGNNFLMFSFKVKFKRKGASSVSVYFTA